MDKFKKLQAWGIGFDYGKTGEDRGFTLDNIEDDTEGINALTDNIELTEDDDAAGLLDDFLDGWTAGFNGE
jgi:hypothetical protein